MILNKNANFLTTPVCNMCRSFYMCALFAYLFLIFVAGSVYSI